VQIDNAFGTEGSACWHGGGWAARRGGGRAAPREWSRIHWRIRASDPAVAAPSTDKERRHNENARRGRVIRKCETAEGDETGALTVNFIVHRCRRDDVSPSGCGIPNPVGAGEFETECLANAGNAVSASNEQQRVVGVEQRNEWAEIIDRDRLNAQAARVRRRLSHPFRVPRLAFCFLSRLDG
jgi:hypothetical protein